MSGGGNTFISKLVDNVFPRMPDFYGLLNDHCDIVARSTDLFVKFIETGDMEIGNQVRAMEKEADAMKAREMEILSKAFATPMDREDIFRAIISIDEVLNYAKTTVREVEALGVKPDAHMFAMAQFIREGTLALRDGFAKLSSKPAEADAEAQAARKAERNTEKVYRAALAELFQADAQVEALRNNAPGAAADAMAYIFNVFKRREIYRHLSNTADRVAHAGEVLHDIVVQIA